MSNSEVDAPWSELSGSHMNTDTSSLSPFCLQFDYHGPGTGKDYWGDAIGTPETSWVIPAGKMGLPSEQGHFFWEFSIRANRKKRFSFSPEPGFSEFLTKWKAPHLSNDFHCNVDVASLIVNSVCVPNVVGRLLPK